MRILLLLLLLVGVCPAQLIPEVRKLAADGNYEAAKARIARAAKPAHTPETVLAYSWIARGAHARKDWAKAEPLAQEARQLALNLLKGRALDAEPNLPLALGASIEVYGHTLANTGRRSEAVAFLDGEIRKWHGTSIRTRTQKNLHVIHLEGKPAPKLEATQFLGPAKMKSLADYKGKPVLLFFWAHWCSDCKAQGPVIDALRKEFPKLEVIAPTQRYGYVAGGVEAPPAEETAYIARVREQHYAWMDGLVMPVSEENFKAFGCSSTPTLALLDKQGIVRMYNPGKKPMEELRQLLATWAK